MPRNPRPHFLLPDGATTTERYRTPNNGGGRPYATPPRERQAHARLLREMLADVRVNLAAVVAAQREVGWEDGFGLRVLFKSFPDVRLAIESLEQRASGIELLSVRESEDGTQAAIWIPEGKLEVFERKIAAYLEHARRDNQTLLDAIRDIRMAVLEDLWTDDSPMPPLDGVGRFEVWISTPRGDDALAPARGRQVGSATRIQRFREAATNAGLVVGERVLRFPERAILQVRGTLSQLQASAHVLGQISELRYAPETAHFFMEQEAAEQRDWSQELLQRSLFSPVSPDTPYVCILDTGVTQGHPLIQPALDANDLFTIDPAWGTYDAHGHGSEQSGLAIWGDLTLHLAGNSQAVVEHRLESVKVQPQDGSNSDEHLGPITIQAVSLPEIANAERRRVFSLALTSTRTTQHGRPTAWSAAIDALASDWAGNGDQSRLMVVSGGNVLNDNPEQYFDINSRTSIEDPAQAWNALTVGALTHKAHIAEPDMHAYQPMAAVGGLSPYTSCSVVWNRESPFKPDVVFEGGNLAYDGDFVSRADSLSLLTTHHLPVNRVFATSEATSGATALASRFAARVMARYPRLWPETIRALVVHSADWTPELLNQFPGGSRDAIEHRLRHCGWGEPNIERALYSGSDSLTLIAQSKLQPFYRAEGRDASGRPKRTVRSRDMHLHRLPWPREALLELFHQQMELRVTLSYFVEPNPGERGYTTRFSYASHGLRFSLQRPMETLDQFRQRVNQLARDAEEEYEPVGAANPDWLLGSRRRFRGSLHHDRLACTAADLAGREHIAVYPVGGWWKTREGQERFNSISGYALVVSTHSPEVPLEIDLYAETEVAIAGMEVAIEVPGQ